ncbi:hypothetical protein [Cognatishimia sp.]|uniref:hypothetical protein n=1 Tax=Cognatishimia sp. TaxID=2211648 RepID=UPI0035185F2A|nr:hypothetical protein [Cognatishimia sp.]
MAEKIKVEKSIFDRVIIEGKSVLRTFLACAVVLREKNKAYFYHQNLTLLRNLYIEAIENSRRGICVARQDTFSSKKEYLLGDLEKLSTLGLVDRFNQNKAKFEVLLNKSAYSKCILPSRHYITIEISLLSEISCEALNLLCYLLLNGKSQSIKVKDFLKIIYKKNFNKFCFDKGLEKLKKEFFMVGYVINFKRIKDGKKITELGITLERTKKEKTKEYLQAQTRSYEGSATF